MVSTGHRNLIINIHYVLWYLLIVYYPCIIDIYISTYIVYYPCIIDIYMSTYQVHDTSALYLVHSWHQFFVVFIFYFSIPFIIFALLFSLPPTSY